MMQKAKQIGLLGGTFNPVHNGHLLLARDVREQCGLDEVWLMPNQRSPLRQEEPLLAAEDRLALLQAAIEGEGDLGLCDLEVRKEGLSYTVETLEGLHRQHPDVHWHFLIGADSLGSLDRWVRIKDLVQLADFIVVARPGFNLSLEAEALFERAPALEGHLRLLHDSRRIDCSATEVRQRVAQGRSIRFLVPDAVQALIHARGFWTPA